MSVHKRSFKNRLSYILLTFIVVLALLTTVFFAQLSRHISEISEFESKQAALDVINAAISQELKKLPQSSYIKISETDGRITSINSDTASVNRLQSSVSMAVNESLSQLEGTKLTVTIEMTAILPAHSTDIVVSYDYPVSETVIVGEIPDMYLDKGKG